MDSIQKLCKGEAKKEEKYEALKSFMRNSKITSGEMLNDKRNMWKTHWIKWTGRMVSYVILGVGYGFVFNLFRKNRQAYLLMPLASCFLFGSFDYRDDFYQSLKIVDRYEIEMIKFFCK